MRKLRSFIMFVMVVVGMMILAGCMEVKDDRDTTSSTETKESSGDEAKRDDDYGPPDTVTTLVFQPAFDSGDAGWGKGVEPWIELVEEATEGTVQFELLPAGSIVSGNEAFGATSDGTIDVYAGWATVYGGQMPEGMLSYGLAMGADNYRDAWAAMWGDPKYRIGDLVQEAANKHNLQWVGWTSQGPNAIFTTFPVEGIDDLKGHKLRAGGPQAIFLEAMGGTPVSMEADEIYTAIDLGTIEGTMWDTGGVKSMRFHEVIDYAIMPGWNPSQAQDIFMNLDAWNSLTQWQRDQIESVFEEAYFVTSRLHQEGVTESLEAIEESGGTIVTLSDEEIAKIREKAIEEIWPKIAAESDLASEGVEIWKQFLTDIGKIE